MNNKIKSFVLNDFLKFERKIYGLPGLNFGRPIQFKTILYFLGFGFAEIVLYFIPIIGIPLRALPFAILLVIPGGLAYLLSDVGTENRQPISFFRSYFSYQIRRLKKVTYYRGKELKKIRTYTFGHYLTIKDYENNKYEEKRRNSFKFRNYLTYK
ncbi:TcpE family conjugal transfer membrane protein [Bacillus subtilis]|uniref:TcpE family conjugal transfer membrane protein n=1 Tax=Bacillus subtilis TaxID=1423 RepID=UPI002DBF3BAF|nr:TcpE family conjugal transfer membrane protein [Bacillus subtilis]MEC0413615.1 TcpE family conjugal transfer membrane protein [Bacillus subtilis]MEC0423275.1 TcpE family conjugal transfer membrane protein [Bacillus subtilis]